MLQPDYVINNLTINPSLATDVCCGLASCDVVRWRDCVNSNICKSSSRSVTYVGFAHASSTVSSVTRDAVILRAEIVEQVGPARGRGYSGDINSCTSAPHLECRSSNLINTTASPGIYIRIQRFIYIFRSYGVLGILMNI